MTAAPIPSDDTTFVVTHAVAATLSADATLAAVDLGTRSDPPKTLRLVFHAETLQTLIDHLQMVRIEAQQLRRGRPPAPPQ